MADGQMTQSTYLDIDGLPARVTALENGLPVQATLDAKQTAAINKVLAISGKNVAKWGAAPVQTSYNVTFTPQPDGTVIVSSSAAASSRSSYRLYLDVSDLESGDYVLTGCPEGGKNSQGSILYNIFIYDETAGSRVVSGEDTGDGLQFTWSIDKTHRYSLVIDVRNTVNIGNKTFKPMLIPKTDYELSPDYESASNPAKKKTTINLTVASSGAMFTSVVNALRFCMATWSEEKEFIVRIAAGTYDLSGVSSLVENSSIDARGLFVMPNMKIIGAGSNITKLTYLYSGSNDSIMSEVSGLNAPYSCELRGFSLTVKNIRYAIHSDHALATESTSISNPHLRDTTIICDDIVLDHQGFDSSLSPTYKVPSCWGAGLWDGSKRFFRHCTMSAVTIAPWFCHDRLDQTIPAEIVFEDCTLINRESSVTVSDSSAACSMCFISWGSGVKNTVSVTRTQLNKYLTLRVVTTQGNANAECDYDVTIGQSNVIVIESDVNGTRADDNYRSDDCITSICQTAAITAYTPVSSKRWYWIHAYNAAETIRGIALNSADVNGVVRVQVKGYIPLNILTASTFTEGTLLGWNGTAYVEDTTHPLLKVIGGNIAQIIANGQ